MARFHRDARRAAAVVQVPTIRADGVIGDHATAPHRLRFAFDAQHAVDEHERPFGEPHPGRVIVDFGEERAEDAADFTHGVLGALLERQRAWHRQRIDRFGGAGADPFANQVVLQLHGQQGRFGQVVLDAQVRFVGIRHGGLRGGTPRKHRCDLIRPRQWYRHFPGLGWQGRRRLFPTRGRRLHE